MKAFEPDEPVVLPSGRRAVIRAVLSDGRLVCRYMDCRSANPEEGSVTLRPELVRRIEHGIVPPPVRVTT